MIRFVSSGSATSRISAGSGLWAALFLLLAGAGPLEGQLPGALPLPPGIDPAGPISHDEVLQRLRASGMSSEEVRTRMLQMGLDPRAADPYLGVRDGQTDRVPSGANPLPLLELLQRTAPDRPAAPPPPVPDSLARQEEPGPPVFGRDLFRRATSEFLPLTTGPVPPDYRLGPGDELVLVLTGGVELAYELPVSREGSIVIPDVGRIFVNDRTLDEVRALLLQRMAQVYSGLRDGADATTFLDVTVGRLRTNQIFVIGDVERPSAYEMSALATGLSALYYAGGPTRTGSFRRVQVNRGGENLGSLDLYDYLVRGLATGDRRLEHGDILFVPTAEGRVEVSGSVIRPGIYEMLPGEDLRDLLRFAGGVHPDAELRRVQVERILPAESRTPGSDRAVLDIPVATLESDGQVPIPVRDGDRIRVFAVLDDVANEVVLAGGVWRPGTYAVDGETRLWDLIERAGGLLPDVVEGRAQVQRVQPDWSRRMIPVSLAGDGNGLPLENPLLEGLDEVYIYAARDLREERSVTIGGWVREPGRYPYVEGMTVADLVLLAGGLRTGAYLASAEVSRVVISQQRVDELTTSLSVPLDSALVFDRGDPADRRSDLTAIAAASVPLENLDALYVRTAPGFDPQARVAVTGEVHFPGPYSLVTRTERLRDVVLRAGGPTDEAYLRGLQLWRSRDVVSEENGEPDALRLALAVPGEEPAPTTRIERVRVGIEFDRALADPSSTHNVLMQPNDSLHMPPFIPTVDVRGGVASPTMVLHREGADLDYYIRQAGGYLENADASRVRVELANGETAVRGRRFLVFGGGIARPDPGSVITVPLEAEREGEGMRVTEFVTILTSVMTATASILIATSR